MNPRLNTPSELGSLKERTIIIGNSGSGKSTLAQSLAAHANASTIDLDLLHWEGNNLSQKRDEATTRNLVIEIAAQPQWIIEGVYGWLAEVAIPRATALIWLDLPWNSCREALLVRGPRRGASDADFAELMTWAEAYWGRVTPSSFIGHLRLFESFPRLKLRLQTHAEVGELLTNLGLPPAPGSQSRGEPD